MVLLEPFIGFQVIRLIQYRTDLEIGSCQATFELGIILFREQNRENLNDFRDQRISPGCAKWNNLFMTQFIASRSVERVICELNMIAQKMDIVYELTKAFTSFIITNKTVEQSRQPIEIENGFRCLSQDVFSFGPALFYPISILSIVLVGIIPTTMSITSMVCSSCKQIDLLNRY